MNLVKITRTFAQILKGNLKNKLSKPSRMISSLNQKWFLALVKKWGFRLVSLSLHSTTKKIHSRVQLFHRFGNYLFVMSRRHGITYTVKYLKACQLAVQKSIAGQPLTTLRELEPSLPLPRLTKSGLPRIIQLRDRAAIRSGSYSVIRMWLTFFSIYRVISSPFNPKLNTITDPFMGNENYLSELKRLVPKGMEVFKVFYGKMHLPEKNLGSQSVLTILKASPGSKVSFSEILGLPIVLEKGGLWSDLKEYCVLMQNFALHGQLLLLENLAKRAESVLGRPFYHVPLGRLSFKEESAGKLRVFAMVDCLTQSTLHGLHEWIFELLSKIPNDGTFDQESAFSRAQDKAKSSGCSFGYDLSAATDRLPIDLQESIIAHWFDNRVAELWRKLLVGRPYTILAGKRTDKFGLKPGEYRYAVGQPMGAYSSWAMLAVTHHFIVQWAHHLSYPLKPLSWFEGYELLGDDIVIFDKIVALKYLEMMQQLGVEINLSKSVVSDPGSVVEFAKRTSVKGVDVSAISLKMVEAASDLKTRVQVALYLGLKTGLSVGNYFKALHALGPSLLYSTTTPTKAYENALARMVAQLVKKDGSNLFAYLASNLNEDSPESFFEGDVMSMKTGKAARLIDDLVKGKDVVLRPTDEQESLFEYLSYDLKSGLAAKVARTYASILESFSKSFPVAVNVLFSPWLEDGDENSSWLNPIESLHSEDDSKMAQYLAFRDEVENFIWVVWYGPWLFDSFNRISQITKSPTFVQASKYCTFDPLRNSMILDQHHEVLTAISELFTDILSDPSNLDRLSIPALYGLLQEAQNLVSYPKRFEFALDKLKGKKLDPIQQDDHEFTIALLNELQTMIRKENAQAQYGEVYQHHHLY